MLTRSLSPTLTSLRETLLQHVRDAVRSVRRSPGFAAMVAATVGLGIGTSAAMFGVVDRLLLRGPVHVVRAGELRRIYVGFPDGVGGHRTTAAHPYAFYAMLRDNAHAFAAIAAYNPWTMRAGEGPEAPRVPVSYVTADFWSLLGLQPALGRFFTEDEDRPPQGRDLVVLGHGFWQRQYAGDAAVVGSAIRLGGRMRTIIGVAPRAFTGAEWGPVDAWVPMSSEARPAGWDSDWDASYARVIGRLKTGVTPQAAGAEATKLFRTAYAGSRTAMRNADVAALPLSYSDQGLEPPELAVARLLLGVAIVVMLISAANAANLLLARGVRQQREIAVRVALGAGRGRLIGMLVAQAIMLAVLGGAAGVAVAHWGGEVARASLFPSVAWDGAPIDKRVLGYMVLAVGVAAILIGVFPAMRISTTPVGAALASGNSQSGATGGGEQLRTRAALQVAQVALSVVLLVVAGLFMRSLMAIERLDLGVRPENVLTGIVALPSANTAETQRQHWLQLLDRVRAMPGVERAAVAVGSPFGQRTQIALRVSGRDSVFSLQESGPFIYAVTPGYFETVGTPLRRGRLFGAGDREGSEPVAIVNVTMARWIWPQQDPIGQCLYLWALSEVPCTRVVGVVADARQSKIREDPVMQYYVPFGHEIGVGGNILLVRVAPGLSPGAFVPTLRAAVRNAAPGALAITVETLASRIDPQIRPWRMGARMFGVFGGLALLVAAVGIFSVVSYLVSQRRQELGVRLALGASAARVVGLVLGGSLRTTGVGAVMGAAFAYALAPFIQPYLFDNSARDAGVFGAVTLAVAIAAIVASLVPSVRACRVNPVIALRAE